MSLLKRLSFGNLTLRVKLFLLVLVLGALAAILAIVLVQQQRAGLERARNEQQGVEYLRRVHVVFGTVTAHRSLAHVFLSGDADKGGQLQSLRREIQANFESLTEKKESFADQPGFTDSFDTIQRHWTTIEARLEFMTAEQSFGAHSRLLEDLQEHSLLAGEGSGLRTTPSLASFYLADSALTQLLTTSEILGRLQAAGAASMIETGEPTTGLEDPAVAAVPDDILGGQQISELTSSLGVNMNTVDRNLELAFTQGQGLRQEGEPVLQAADRRIAEFREATEQAFLRTETSYEGTRDQYFALGAGALSSLSALSSATLSSLDRILDVRISGLSQQLRFVLAGLALALLAAIGLAIFIVRALTRQVSAISSTFARIGIGDFSARVKVHSTDELGRLSESLNAMLDNTMNLVQTADERDRIQNNIMKLLEEISGLAEGDLTAEAEVTAEITGAIADSFNFMTAELRRIIRNVQKTAAETAVASEAIRATTEDLAQGSGVQAMQIAETSSSVEAMVSSIQQVSSNAEEAAGVADQALTAARRGNRAVLDTIQGMNDIRQHVRETTKRMKRLGESSQEIGEIVRLIGEIADRTSILALNASIQAAAAGEAGKGFVIVAEEVERLADRSAEASKRIDGLIRMIRSETNEAVTAMEETTREVVSGSQLANEAGRTLEQIENVSQRLADLIGQITSSATEQARGSDAISQAMGKISGITQKTAAGTQSAAERTRNLAELIERLRESVSAFQLPPVDAA